MKTRDMVLLIGSLLFCAGLFAQTTVETPAAGEGIQQPGDQLAIQDKQKKEPPVAAQYDRPPEMVKQSMPDYPNEALKDKLEGLVTVSLWIDESGKVAEAKVVETDNQIFNQAAMDAGKRWVFKPAISKGKPIAVWVTVPFRFTLHDAAKAPSPGLRFKERVTKGKNDSPDEHAKAIQDSKLTPDVRFKERVTTPKSNPPDENAKVDQGPEPLKQVIPKYPEAAKRDKIMGTVWTKLWVDEKGRVVDVTVTKSDNEVFNQAAIEAAHQWVFKPAIAKGQPVAVWVDLPFKFALK